jgi:GT2 family glycosyltransferase
MNSIGKAVALAMSSPIGVGNAKHRYPHYEGYAEGASFPTFKKEIFDKIGMYDEKLLKNQDDELNYRLTKSGGKVYLSPKVKCIYFVREKIGQLFNQYFQYGFWRVAVIRKHKSPVSFRQVIPALFFVLIFLLLILGFLLPNKYQLISYILPLSYLVIIIFAGIISAIKNGLIVGLNFPLVVFILHFAYAMGFLKGLIRKEKV